MAWFWFDARRYRMPNSESTRPATQHFSGHSSELFQLPLKSCLPYYSLYPWCIRCWALQHKEQAAERGCALDIGQEVDDVQVSVVLPGCQSSCKHQLLRISDY
jgi:hypothetical protein